MIYKGAPVERKQLDITSCDFILMSIQIFKKDFDYLYNIFEHRPVILVVDEAKAVKNIGSANYKRVRDFAAERDLLLLEGTPLATPEDAYA